MDFEQKNLMKYDVLWISKFLFIEILNHKTIRYTFIGALFVHVVIYLIEFYNLCNHPEYFLKYGPWIMAKPFGYLGVLLAFAKRKHLETIWSGLELWAIDSAGKEIEEKIKKTIRNHHIFLFAVLTLGVVFSMLALVPNSNDHDFFLSMHLFEMKYPQYNAVIYMFVIKLLYAPMLYFKLFSVVVLSYLAEHIKFQAYMLAEHVKHLSHDFDGITETELLNDENYQNIMFKRIKFCVARHVDILIFSVRSSQDLAPGHYFGMVAICGFFLGMFAVMVLYGISLGVYEKSALNISCVGIFITIITVAFFHFVYMGQTVENESENLSIEFSKLRWTCWNKNNRKTMLVILPMAMKPIKVQFSQNFAINHKIGLKMAKGIYSTLSVFISVRRK